MPELITEMVLGMDVTKSMSLVMINNKFHLHVPREEEGSDDYKTIGAVVPLMSEQGRMLTQFLGAELKLFDLVSGPMDVAKYKIRLFSFRISI